MPTLPISVEEAIGAVSVAELIDVTDYAFASPSTGRRIFVNYSDDRLDDEQFRALVRESCDRVIEYAHAKEIGRGDQRLEYGRAVTVTLWLPPEVISKTPSKQWLSFVHMPEGDTAQLSLYARADDTAAEKEYQRVLGSIRKAETGRGPLAAVRSAVVEKTASPRIAVGPITIDVPTDYVRPEFRFATRSGGHFTLRLGGAEIAVSQPGDLVKIQDDDGQPVTVLKGRDLWARRPSAARRIGEKTFLADKVPLSTVQFEVLGSRVQLQATKHAERMDLKQLADMIRTNVEKSK